MRGDCAAGFAAEEIVYVPPCLEEAITLELSAGMHWLVVAPGDDLGPIFHGIDCRTSDPVFEATFGGRYRMSVACD